MSSKSAETRKNISRSFWNNGEIKGSKSTMKHLNHISYRDFPTESPSSKSTSHPRTVVSANTAPSNTPSTTTNKSEVSSYSLTPTSSPLPPPISLASSAVFAMATANTSASNSSFYDTLQAEAASCCPLCGFQVLEVNTSITAADLEIKFSQAGILSGADVSPYQKGNNVQDNNGDDGSRSSLLRSFVTNQQELLLNIHGNIDSSDSFCTTRNTVTSTISGYQVDTKLSNLPAGTCWVCLCAAAKAAKERQVEEDRKLAYSLSAIALEEERGALPGSIPLPHNNNNNNNRSYSPHGDDGQQVPSLGDYDPYHCNSSRFFHGQPQGDLSQEWSEERYGSIPTASTAVTGLIEKDQPQHQTYNQSNSAVWKTNTPTNLDCNTDRNKQSIANADDACVYIGEYNSEGRRHGSHGELIWDSGDRYVGTFKNGMRSGQGTFFFKDGSEFTGDWKENEYHGCGQRKFANGDTYVGQYHKGQRSGGPMWKFKFANGDLYAGGWKADQFHGFGRYFYADGTVLEGNFADGIKQGKFKRQLPTEELDILRFEDDRLVGQGVRWNTKRTKTWLLELCNTHYDEVARTRNETSDSLTLQKAARRMVLGIGNFTRRHDLRKRQRNFSDGLKSSVDTTHNIKPRKEAETCTTGTAFISPASTLPSPSPSSSSLPLDNLVPVFPQKSTKSIVKKSIRIPISQAVSIGYDCEIGTERGIDQILVK